MVINLNNIVSPALTIINPFKEFTFTTSSVEWSEESRKPIKNEKTVVLKGKLQPASLNELKEIVHNLFDYQYFRVYLSANRTELDKVRQLGSDEFICEGLKYRVVNKEDWFSQAGWRAIYCYLIEATND